jgi:hypothetical protein
MPREGRDFQLLPREGENTFMPHEGRDFQSLTPRRRKRQSQTESFVFSVINPKKEEEDKGKERSLRKLKEAQSCSPRKRRKERKRFLRMPEETRTNILGEINKASQERKRGVLRKYDYKEHAGKERKLRIWQ